MSSTSNQSFSASAALAVLTSKKQGKHYLCQNEGIIGRSPSAFLSIPDNHISRVHCVIQKTEDNKFTICDKSSTGTYLNGQRLIKNTVNELKHHDLIRLSDLDMYTFAFVINKKRLGIQSPPRGMSVSELTDQLNDLNESQCLEKEKMEKEFGLVSLEMDRLQEELQKLKEHEKTIEQKRLEASIESASNKEQADIAEAKLKEAMEEKERVVKEYEHKFADVTKKVEELQQTRIEMENRHQIEREELEKKCKAEIEELKNKMEHAQNQQFEELQSKLEEAKNVLIESELEQQRLFEAKAEVETTLESKIIELTNNYSQFILPTGPCPVEILSPTQHFVDSIKSKWAEISSLTPNEKENQAGQVKELEMKLKEKEEQEEKVKREIDGLEDDLMCSICAELYIEPTALNCGHMFCKQCITEWSKKKKICPMCRANIVTTVRIFNMDSVIQRNIRLMSEEAQSRREALITERKKRKTPQKKKSSKKRRSEPEIPNQFYPAEIHNPFNRFNPAEMPNALNLNQIPNPFNPATNNNPAGRRHRRLRMEIARPAEDTPQESEGDPFQAGWLRGRNLPLLADSGRFSPVTIAAVDLTNIPMVQIPTPAATRVHTITSGEANTTIDLTDL
ncbi:E3 ubiquitin-protein ligase rnf8-like isoform X1 [Macrosteles quadrilineatus]|uniref:E3 ubiquitin-protein ligase rnf8-like isoform X1 n=1 Tax=Macrosteles quadrilineatus TaxID=74068 RepID=UPI0023E2F30C|nr:E3 ubiquitin-protein ligase rnf8-like isoform X1 [Macrosteles quadrilineatus]